MTPLWFLILLIAMAAVALQLAVLRLHRALAFTNATDSSRPRPRTNAAVAAPVRTDGGVIYIDNHGRCTLADGGARELLRLGPAAVSLHDLFAGGAPASDELLQALARQGVVERRRTAFRNAPPLDIHAVAVRDRDDNFWGAAVFLQRPSRI